MRTGGRVYCKKILSVTFRPPGLIFGRIWEVCGAIMRLMVMIGRRWVIAAVSAKGSRAGTGVKTAERAVKLEVQLVLQAEVVLSGHVTGVRVQQTGGRVGVWMRLRQRPWRRRVQMHGQLGAGRGQHTVWPAHQSWGRVGGQLHAVSWVGEACNNPV